MVGDGHIPRIVGARATVPTQQRYPGDPCLAWNYLRIATLAVPTETHPAPFIIHHNENLFFVRQTRKQVNGPVKARVLKT